MNKFRDAIDEENENVALLDVPGAATVKAFSIVVNSFLQHPLMPESISNLKSLTYESVNDLAYLNNSISQATTAGKNEPTPDGSEVLPEISKASKNQGMIHHLKNLHAPNHRDN